MATRIAGVLDSLSRVALWFIAFVVVVLVPWLFGGMGPEGYWVIVWAGRACLLPLALWAVSSILIRRAPPVGFWVALGCWGLLSVQVWVSMGNVSHVMQAPWIGNGYDRIPHDPALPCTASVPDTFSEGRLWLSFGLLALGAHVVGLGRKSLRVLVWCLAVNVVVLALLGIPFKFSGNYLLLGRWPMPESYFYSTFIYHNHWTSYALLGLAGAVGLFFEGGARWLRLVLLVGIFVVFASSIIAVSRLGTLFMGGFLLFTCVMAWSTRKGGRAWTVRGLGLWAGVAFVTILLIATGAAYLKNKGPGAVGQRSWGYIAKNNPFTGRLFLVEDAMPMVREKPVWGWGLGSFGIAFRNYQRPETIVVHNQGRVTRYEHCHNDWMERLVELGVFGLGLCLLPFVYWGWRGRCYIRGDWLCVFLWAAVGCVCLFALGDMVFVNRSLAATMAVLLGLLSGGRPLRSGELGLCESPCLESGKS